MYLHKIKQKKAAIELSIGTVVIIVLAMSMLILGLVLVRSIFTGAIDSTQTLNDKVKGEITNLFAEEGKKVVVKLGGDKTATIKAGEDFGIGVGARAPESGPGLSDRKDLQFTLELQPREESPDNCVSVNGVANVGQWFGHVFDSTGRTARASFDEFSGRDAYTILRISVPDTAIPCTQKVFIEVFDNRPNSQPQSYEGTSFILKVEEGGIFS